MEISISEQNNESIRRKVDSGKYSSPDDVLDKALKALDEQDEELEDVRAKVQEGTDQLKRGEYIECTEETLDAVLIEIEAEALGDIEARRPHAD